MTDPSTEEAKSIVKGDEELVPTKYHPYLDVFSKNSANKLPLHRPFDHHIPLVEGKQPPSLWTHLLNLR